MPAARASEASVSAEVTADAHISTPIGSTAAQPLPLERYSTPCTQCRNGGWRERPEPEPRQNVRSRWRMAAAPSIARSAATASPSAAGQRSLATSHSVANECGCAAVSECPAGLPGSSVHRRSRQCASTRRGGPKGARAGDAAALLRWQRNCEQRRGQQPRGAQAKHSGTAAEHLEAHARTGDAVRVACSENAAQRLQSASSPSACSAVYGSSKRARAAHRCAHRPQRFRVARQPPRSATAVHDARQRARARASMRCRGWPWRGSRPAARRDWPATKPVLSLGLGSSKLNRAHPARP